MEKAMELAIEEARKTMNENIGGPFGAAIIDETGKIISVSSNSVLKDNDPTGHAEINAIRKAGKELKTHDLKNCVLYTTSFPCPMCLSAIIWSNIKKVYFGCNIEDAEEIGFRDKLIYEYLSGSTKGEKLIETIELEREECKKLFKEYVEKNKEIY